jgi:L,D-transpeptidase-like protein
MSRRQPGRASRHWSIAFIVIATLVALSMILGACATDPQQAAAQQAKAKLDSLLQPIERQEQAIAGGAGGSRYSYSDATANYALLYSQLIGIEQTAIQTLQTQTQNDLQAFSDILITRRTQGFSEASDYQARLDQALKRYAAAKTAGDFAQLDSFVRQQTGALNALWPAWQKLQDFKATLHAVHLSGASTSLSDLEYSQDLQAFRDASSTDRYQRLVGVIDGQILQLVADQTEALPYVGATMLAIFQARVNDLRAWGETRAADAFQQQHDGDAKDLAAAQDLADYLTLAQLITKQSNAMTLPWFRGQAREDLRQLRTQVDVVMAKNPLLAYEYADQYEGVGNMTSEFNGARSVDDYLRADADTRVMLTNLRALQDNLRDTTAPSQAHRVDLQLMQTYNVMTGKVIVISLIEQTARLYENGALVFWAYVTTGRVELPTPPGLHFAMQKLYHTEFKSSEPKNSPLWYAPTAINYAILFANYGFFLHDAWWRYQFGPGSNLPHWDPLAFNDGTHGCVNFAEDNMTWIYNWTPLGTPVIIY